MPPIISQPPVDTQGSVVPTDYRDTRFPAAQPGEEARAYVLGLSPRLRGRRNPIQVLSIFGQEFPQYRMPADWSVITDEPRYDLRPNLPIVALTDSQVERLREEAKELRWQFTYSAPFLDDKTRDEYLDDGHYEGTYDELIFIMPYDEGTDYLAIIDSAKVAYAASAADGEGDEAKAPDFQSAVNAALLRRNGEAQRDSAKRREKAETSSSGSNGSKK